MGLVSILEKKTLTPTGLLQPWHKLDIRYLKDYICYSATKAYIIIMSQITLKTPVAYSVLALSMGTSNSYAQQH